MYSGDFKRRRNGNNQNKNRQFENRRDNRHQPFNNRIPGAEGAFPPKVPPIDRKKVCPFLLNVYPRPNAHHPIEAFADRDSLPEDKIVFYTWQDATLRELCDLVKEVFEPARNPAARISFAFIYPDRSGRNVLRQVGSVHSSRAGSEDDVALRDLKFQTGDYLSVCVY